jgi:predicted permease
MLSTVLPIELRDDVLGDLQEGFLSRLSATGGSTARRWYWRQALQSLRYARGGANAPDPQPGRRTSKLQRAFMGFFKYDVSYAIRQLRSNPGFTAVAVLSLALGIGVNSTIFTVVNGFLLKPLPVADIDEVIEVFTRTPNDPFNMSSYLDYVDYRDGTEAFDGLAAEMTMLYNWNRDTHSEMLFGGLVSGNYFDVLGVEPGLGRWFIPEENKTPRTHPVVVLAHGFWERSFAGDPSVIGDTIKLNGTHFTIVGVAPAEFTGTIPVLQPDLWAPLMTEPIVNPFERESPFIEARGTRSLRIYGRLAAGGTIEQARTQLETVAARLADEYPDSNEDRTINVKPLSEIRLHPNLDSAVTPVAGMLMGLVGLVLLVACANVANMLLARSSTRRREIAVRLALGASRGALIRGLLTESLLLAGAGGAAGWVLSMWAMRALSRLPMMNQMTLDFDMGVDFRVLAFAFGVSLLTGLTFGLLPALRASRPDLVPALKDGEAAEAGGRRGFGLRDVLVVSQVAVSLLLLVAAGLLLRSLQGAQDIELGFDADNTAKIDMQLDMLGYEDEQADVFQRQYLERVRALPQVEAAALTQKLPLGADISITGIFIPGVHEGPDDEGEMADEAVVGPGYFETLAVPLIQGRDFTDSDTPDTPLVAIVNETMARTFWPGENVVGKRFRTSFDGDDYEIVGMSADHKVRTLGEEPRALVHKARTQRRSTYAIVVARTAGDSSALAGTLRDELEAMAPDLPSRPSTVRESVDVTLMPVTLGALMLAGLGLLATVLAALGLYGVIAYSVSRRVREIGIRIALGADRLGVIKLVVGRGMALAAVGVGVGALGAAALSGLLGSFLYGVSALDPLSFAGAAMLLLGVAFLANYLPARRAARVDPLVALRSD